jgi:hypothetical protein
MDSMAERLSVRGMSELANGVRALQEGQGDQAP